MRARLFPSVPKAFVMIDRIPDSPFIGITIEAWSRPCEICPLRVQYGNGFVWEWASLADDTRSEQTFEWFFECLEDARKHGYDPQFLDRRHDLTVVPMRARP
jgi:hypothetical protein